MIILLPLTLIGIGAFIYFIFNTATYALPIAVGAAAGLACAHAGASPVEAILIGVTAFMLTIAVARFVALTAPRPIRIAVVAALAIPAAFVGYHMGLGLAGLSGLPALLPAIPAATLAGLVAANRITRPA